MDHFDITTGVLDSCDLLHPFLDTFIPRNKGVQVSSLNLFTSSSSVLLKKTSYTPVLNSISEGYYPAIGGFYRTCPPSPPAHVKPLVHVTVSPRSKKTVNDLRKRKQRKRTPDSSDHSLCSKRIYIVVPGTKKHKVYAVETTFDRISKDITDNKLLSECMIKSYIRSMNKAKKKNPDKVKEKVNQLKAIPECSPTCAFMNMNINKEKNAASEKSGSLSPRSPVRSSYKIATQVESKNSITTIQRRTKSPDRSSQDARGKSSVRSNQQKAKISINQTYKNRKEESRSPDRFSFINNKRSIESVIAEEKRRSPDRYEKRASSPTRGGRIRITGRLGIDEDDKCVLKCDATLNDQPIPTQYQGATCPMLPICFQTRNEEVGISRKQHDATVQAKEKGARFLPNYEIRKESQATQVDFQFSYSPAINQRGQCGRGKIMQQCACVNTDDNARQILETKEDPGFGLKKQHNPLIVISVYSKNASNDSSDDVKQKNKTIQKKENKTVRSRSPSPARSPKKLGTKKSESRVNASTSKKTVRETTKKEIRSKANQSQSKTVLRSTTVTKSKFENKTNKSKASKSQKTPPQSRRFVSPQINQEDDKAELKRALIDGFTKTYTEQINQRNAQLEIPLQTKHNVSNITIDIEGDSDYYNVKLEQDVGKLNTELTVRKPNRRDRAGDMTMGETDTTSMENFLYMPEDEPRKRSFSQTLMFDGTDLTMNSELGAENELNVKDSIEISHKREHRTSSDGNRERNDISIEVDSIQFAPDKHFQGDDCSISDPNARDKEIRRLLEIDKGVKKCRIRPSQPRDVVDKGCQAPVERSLSTDAVNENAFNTIILTRPLCLNNYKHNIQLLYQLRLRKPIVLTLSQYAKLKKTIYKTSLTKHNHSAKWYYLDRNYNDSRSKTVRTERKSEILHYDKNSQTDNELLDQKCATSGANTYIIEKNVGIADSTSRYGRSNLSSEQETIENVINYNSYSYNVLKTVYIATETNFPIKEEIHKKAASVKDIQCIYRRMDSRQKVKFSSSDSANYISRGQDKKNSYSLHTIFKCRKKSITPNLGVSAYSLCHGEPVASRIKFFEDSCENLTVKKPFLKRLISCLVFKVSPAPETQNQKAWQQNCSPCNSFDSYHISTSLGAMEMSSSLYDTTASFYSDHCVQDVKKRGFFSSVRGFLFSKQ